jgi:hypothetical protein
MNLNITIGDLMHLTLARCFLRLCQKRLYAARIVGNAALIELYEECVGIALDRLWEAQQRAA